MGGPCSRIRCKRLNTQLVALFCLILYLFRLDGYVVHRFIYVVSVVDISALQTIRTTSTFVLLPSSTGLPQGADRVLQTAAIGVAGEITASSILITYWDNNVSFGEMDPHRLQLILRNQSKHLAIYITVVILIVIGINLMGSRYFGECKGHVPLLFESFLLTKILSGVRVCNREAYVLQLILKRGVECFFGIVTMLTGLILFGLIIDLGGGPDHDRRGFRVRLFWTFDHRTHLSYFYSTGMTLVPSMGRDSNQPNLI